jgi:hypothetical protein
VRRDEDASSVQGTAARLTATPADNPIERSEDDTLGRSDPARLFAEQILQQDASKGFVVAVLGAWGSGKTSFVNLARERLGGQATILDFNPWMFSGAEQLVSSFFIELAAQLKIKPDLQEIAGDLEDYGEAFSGLGWLPVVGAWIERGRLASKLIGKLLQRRKEGIGARREKLRKALTELEQPIVVVLDDIDRLATNEIRDIFKLVRLVASFPNIIYLLAFDRERIETALGEEGVPGRAYLEKILQLGIDLPAVPDEVIMRQTFAALDAAFEDLQLMPLDEEVWPDVYMEVIRPLIRSMRDVRRYVAGARSALESLGSEIAVADLLALEAVRVFLPEVFARFHGAVAGLTTPAAGFGLGRTESEELKEQVEGLLTAAASRRDVVEALVLRLFPAGSRHLPGGTHYTADWQKTWLRKRRVAHESILRLYLERVAGSPLLAFRAAERAWEVMTDRDQLSDYLHSLEPDQLEDVIAALETYEADFTPAHTVPGTIVLLNLLPNLPDRPVGMFDLGARFVVGRVTYRLLKGAGDHEAVADAVRQILPELETLSAKSEVVIDIGYREGAGHKFVSEDAAKEFERAWRGEVRAASAEDLLREPDPLRSLFLTKRHAEKSEPPLNVPDTPEVTLALLRDARSDVRSQSVGSRAVRRSPRLAWEVLLEVFGDEETLHDRIASLEESDVQVDEDLMTLAKRYVAGWRPKEFGEDDE